MKQNTLFKPATLIPATITLSRRQWLLTSMTTLVTAVLLAAKPLALAPAARANIANPQAIGAFEGLRLFLRASAHPRVGGPEKFAELALEGPLLA